VSEDMQKMHGENGELRVLKSPVFYKYYKCGQVKKQQMEETRNAHGKDETCIRYEMSPRSRREDDIKMKLEEHGVFLWNEIICSRKETSAGWREHGNQYVPSSVL
jgi:hypothetical protein